MQLDLFTSPASASCQRWADRSPFWRHPRDGGFDRTRYLAELIPGELAERVVRPWIERHHYAGSYVAARLVVAMTTDDPRLAPADAPELPSGLLVGAAVLSVPTNVLALTNVFPELEPYDESLELGRFLLSPQVPANGESWLLGKMLRTVPDVGIRGVVSFSDPMARARTVNGVREVYSPGHVGLIYQAANAVPLGRSTRRTLTMIEPGRPTGGLVLSDRSLQKARKGEPGGEGLERRVVALGATPRRAGQTVRDWLPTALDEIGARRVPHPGNFRYAWAVGTKAQRRLTRLAGERTSAPKPAFDLVPAAA